MTISYKTASFITFVIVVGILIAGYKYLPSKNIGTSTTDNTDNSSKVSTILISIKDQDIKETNFTGKKSIITGSGVIVEDANKYIENEFSSFKERADKEVPQMIKDFGASSPPINYSLYLQGKYIEGNKTQSIVLSEYMYTGGANGMSIYKVFTALKKDNKILSINNIIIEDKQADFVSLVKQKLIDWRPEGMTESAVFEDNVSALTINSFKNWSLDKKNLTIYFDKYEIGAGALGAVPFNLPLTEVNNYLKVF